MATLPNSRLDEVAPTGQIAASAPADVAVFLGCSTTGTAYAIVSPGPQYLTGIVSSFTNGPLVSEGGYIANKIPVSTLFVNVPATQVAAAASAFTYTGTGTLGGGGFITLTGSTPADGFDVVIKCTTAGTTGTSFSVAISLDGGSTYASPVALSSGLVITVTGTLNGVSIATGMTVTVTTGKTLVLGDLISFWTSPASASILTQTVTRVATSTSTLVYSGTPNDEYEILTQFLTAGTEGAGNTITFWCSLDGGLTFGAVQQLNAGGTYLIPDGAGSSGVTLTVGSGTVDALDKVAAKTTGPVPAFADVQTAMNAVRNYGEPWSFFHLCGRSTRAMRDSIDALLLTYATSGRFTWCSLSARDRIAGESVAASANNVLGDTAWANRLITEWGTSAGTHTPPLAGSCRRQSPVPGAARQNRASDAVAYLPRIIGITPDTDPGDRTLPNNGACSSDILITVPTSGVIAPANAGAIAEHDARLNPSLYSLGFNVLRTWYGEQGLQPGVSPAGGRLMSAPTDIQRWCHMRVIRLADGALGTAASNRVLQKFDVYPATVRAPYAPGDIQEPDRVGIVQALFLAAQNAVGNYVSSGSLPNGKGGITVTVNKTPAVVAGNETVYWSCQLVNKPILDNMVGTVGFVNPALGAITTPA